jgi:hypothetical protein
VLGPAADDTRAVALGEVRDRPGDGEVIAVGSLDGQDREAAVLRRPADVADADLRVESVIAGIGHTRRLMSSPEAKNLEAISKAIDQHERTCEYPTLAVLMNPFEVERLGWDEIRGVPVRADEKIGTGRFEILCAGDGEEPGLEESVEAVAEQEQPLVIPVGSPN